MWNESILGKDSNYIVAVWKIGTSPFVEVINKQTGVTTGGWQYEAS